MLGLIFSVAGQQHRERSVIQTRDDRIRVRFVPTRGHLVFREERFRRREDRQQRTATEIQFHPRFGSLIMSATRTNCRFVIVVELRQRSRLRRSAIRGRWLRGRLLLFWRRRRLRRYAR